MITETKQKYSPGDKVRVTGNTTSIGVPYHYFEIGQDVEIISFKNDFAWPAWRCKNAKGTNQTIFERDLQPLNP